MSPSSRPTITAPTNRSAPIARGAATGAASAFMKCCGSRRRWPPHLSIYRFKPNLDLISNVFPRTYPVGTSVEIIKTDSLKKILSLNVDSCDREHVTRFFYRNPEKFRILNFESDRSELREVRLAVDTEEDLERIDWLFKEFGGLINFEMAAEKSLLWSRVE